MWGYTISIHEVQAAHVQVRKPGHHVVLQMTNFAGGTLGMSSMCGCRAAQLQPMISKLVRSERVMLHSPPLLSYRRVFQVSSVNVLGTMACLWVGVDSLWCFALESRITRS